MKLIKLLVLFLVFSCATNKVKHKKPTNDVQVNIEKTDNVADIFTVNSSLKWMQETTRIANCVAKSESFKSAVERVDRFDYSEDNGKQVYQKLINAKCNARTYKTRSPWSKVNATTYSSNRVDFYLNTRNNPRSTEKMVNTWLHECLHLSGYSHGDNNRAGKQDSVNYKIGKLAELNTKRCL